MTLVCGAGVSAKLNIPTWDQLVDTLYRQIYRSISTDLKFGSITEMRRKGRTTNLTMIRNLENVGGFREEVRRAVRDRLYLKYDESSLKYLVTPICKLFLRKGLRYPIRDVITYNFDNTIERELRSLGRTDVHTVYTAESYPVHKRGIQIYHPHGFLPHPDDDPHNRALEANMVFSERDYNLHFMDPSHWANVVQLHHFMHRTCLFIGISMADINMRRLLDHAHERTKGHVRHISIQRAKGDNIADAYLEKDLSSLGMDTLWVTDYSEIPKVLRKCASVN